jgi:hypothetical protein
VPLKTKTVNYIDKIRNDIKKDFNEETFEKGDEEMFLSPSKQFRLETTNFFSKELNWDLTKVKVYDQHINEQLFDFFVNESRFFFGWVTTNEVSYLICAEDIFGGQTIIDLTNRLLVGYSPSEDGFIWTDFHLSPDGKVLATIGCYWACPYVIKLFDFSNPLTLPLKEMREIRLLENDETIVRWLDNETLKMKGVQREREPEYFEGGSMRMNIISETPIEREIKINGT